MKGKWKYYDFKIWWGNRKIQWPTLRKMAKIKINDKFIEVRIELSGSCKRENWYFIDENGFTKKCYSLEGYEIDID